ncbi:unnamed protein product, partial [Didymodactylos carnosus]
QDPKNFQTSLKDIPFAPLPMLPPELISGGNKKDCIRVRNLPVESNIEQILEFLGVHSQHIVAQGVHMVYNAHGMPSGEAFIQMDSESAAYNASSHKHNKYMFFSGKKRYIEVLQCSGEDMNLVLLGLVPSNLIPTNLNNGPRPTMLPPRTAPVVSTMSTLPPQMIPQSLPIVAASQSSLQNGNSLAAATAMQNAANSLQNAYYPMPVFWYPTPPVSPPIYLQATGPLQNHPVLVLRGYRVLCTLKSIFQSLYRNLSDHSKSLKNWTSQSKGMIEQLDTIFCYDTTRDVIMKTLSYGEQLARCLFDPILKAIQRVIDDLDSIIRLTYSNKKNEHQQYTEIKHQLEDEYSRVAKCEKKFQKKRSEQKKKREEFQSLNASNTSNGNEIKRKERQLKTLANDISDLKAELTNKRNEFRKNARDILDEKCNPIELEQLDVVNNALTSFTEAVKIKPTNLEKLKKIHDQLEEYIKKNHQPKHDIEQWTNRYTTVINVPVTPQTPQKNDFDDKSDDEK